MKKIICLISIIIITINLTACATSGMQNGKGGSTIPALVTPAFDKAMGDDDHNKLIRLISVGKPKETTTWKSESGRHTYQFTSLGIYINEQGQPCRRYKIHGTFFWHDHDMVGTACRINDASWRGASQEVK